jgi:hypothetical protein
VKRIERWVMDDFRNQSASMKERIPNPKEKRKQDHKTKLRTDSHSHNLGPSTATCRVLKAILLTFTSSPQQVEVN